MNKQANSSRRLKHDQLTQQLREQFLTKNQPGDQLPTIRALARQHQVSEPTLRTALLTLAQEGLVDLQQGRGTFMRQRQANQHVAIVMDLDLSYPTFSYYWRRLAQQIRRYLRDQGYSSRLYFGELVPGSGTSHITCTDFLEAIAADQVGGVVMLYGAKTPQWEEPLRQRGVPVVGFMDGYDHWVTTDGLGLLRSATRRLLTAGRRKIAFMRWAPRGPAQPEGEGDRELDVFRTTLAERGATFREEWVRGDIHPNLPGGGWEEFREIWAAGPERPDGLVINDEVLFQSAVPAILELGIRVPEDLLIVSHATKGAGTFYPFPVWLMEVDPDEVAVATGGLVTRLLRGEAVPESPITVPVHWVDSEEVTGPPTITAVRS